MVSELMNRLVRQARLPILALLVATALPIPVAGGATGASPTPAPIFSPTLPRHEISVILFPSEQRLEGTDTIRFPPGSVAPVTLSLSAGARVKRVSAGGKAVPFTFDAGTLSVRDLPGDGGSEIDLTVAYEAFFRDPVPENPANAEDPGYGVVGTISPKGVFLSDEAGWYPGTRGPALFRLRVAAPEGFEAVTDGVRFSRGVQEGRSRSEWDISVPSGGISLSAGRYVVREGRSGDIPLYACFLPEDEALADKYLKAADGYLALYREMLGPYPFGKFAIVENFFPTGYGFPSWTLLGSVVVRLPFIVETSLGHEIAHSWWGNGVRVDPASGNWSEGLTTYLADHLYKERLSAAEGREYREKLLRDFASLVPPAKDFPLRRFSSRSDPVTHAVGYGKAAMVFHMARLRAGDDAFRDGLRRIVRERMHEKASWDDFARVFGEASGKDFGPFLRQWVDRAGAPVLSLSGVRKRRAGEGWEIAGKVVQEAPHFAMSVPVRLESADGTHAETVVEIAGGEAAFALRTRSMPARLLMDPDVGLFRRLDPSEIPPSVNAVRGSDALVVVASADLSADTAERCRTLLEAMGRGDAPVVRETDATPDSIAGRDVLLLGVPRDRRLLPPLPGGLALSASRFTLDGTVYEKPPDALFSVFARPGEAGRVTALFLPLSPSAAAAAARKIPHYGKYGFLVFSDGVNRAKGSWPAAASPSAVDLSRVPEGTR
jgi:hypothetical protein